MGRVVRTRIQQKGRERSKESRVLAVRKNALNTADSEACKLVDPNKPLTEKQLLFAAAIADGDNPPNALIKAGFNSQPSYSYRLILMPNIKREIKRLQELNAEAAQLTRIDVMNMHLEAFNMAKLMSEPASMTAAAREIGKMCGFYEPKKIELTLNGTRKKIEELTDADLFARIEEEMARVNAGQSAALPG